MARRLLVLPALLALLLTLAPLGAAGEEADRDVAASLPAVDSGERPGPDVLYAPRPAAPQLDNHDPRFTAEPLLVSGTEAYVDGEYLYQDYLYDDFGADTDGNDGGALAPSAGDLEYPTDRDRYADNAADLVELRIAPGDDEVAYRFTLNTLLEAHAPIIALALDTDGDEATGTDALPGDPGAPFPGTDEVLTTWGTGATHTTYGADGGEVAVTDVEVEADLDAAQITVTVPREVADPAGTLRATLAVGLHDGEGGWLLPQESADDENPGGASLLQPDAPGIFNLGFRFDEPIEEEGVPPDTLQAEALADGEPTRFAHEIDFDALAAGETRSTVPETGTMVRLFPSRLDAGEGKDLSTFPGLKGQLQPYSVHVPEGYDQADPPGFTLNLHSLSSNHWQYNGSEGVRQLGEQRDHVVATPQARGDDGWYQHEAEYDVFEVWNDVAHHYALDPDRASSAGYSMGGMGTYRLATRYPDLFGAAFTTVGPPGEGIWVPPSSPTGGRETLSNLWLENARNVPFLNVAAGGDELVPIIGPTAQNTGLGGLADGLVGAEDGFAQVDDGLGFQSFEELGYRYHYRVYPGAEHFTLAVLSYDIPGAAEFLGDAEVDREPHHVTFAAVPDADDAELGLVADHAYWVSGVTLADPDTDDVAKGVVDAFSHGHGLGRPEAERHGDGGVGPAALPWTEVGLDWADAPELEPANRVDVTLTNTAAATLDVVRAALDPDRELTVEVAADAAGELTLDGTFSAGTEVLRDGEPVAGASAGPDGAVLPVEAGEHVYLLVPGEGQGEDPADDAPGRHGRATVPATPAPPGPRGPAGEAG
jgi:hypothetical protein